MNWNSDIINNLAWTDTIINKEAKQKVAACSEKGIVDAGITDGKIGIEHAKYIRAKSTDSCKKNSGIWRKCFILD